MMEKPNSLGLYYSYNIEEQFNTNCTYEAYLYNNLVLKLYETT